MFKIPIHGGVDLFGAYKNKVYSGGGSIRNEFVAKTILNFYKNSGQLNNLRLLVAPELGMTLFNDGTDLTVSKLYSVDSVPNDVVQGTAASQPYLAGDIAPTEKFCLNNPNGATRFMTHPTISYSATDKWSVTFVCVPYINSSSSNNICGKNLTSSIGFSNLGRFFIINENSLSHSEILTINQYIGKITIITCSSSGTGNINVFFNGNFIIALTLSSIISFEILMYGRISYYNNKLYYYKIQNGDADVSFVKSEYNMLRSIFPEIESVQIGTQTWATSNFEAVATPMGNIIPEITDNTAWAALTTPAWCHYNNSTANGAIYGKLYNWYAVKLLQDDITAYNLANPTKPFGWHVPTQAEFTTLQTYLGGASVAGGKLKKEGTTYWNTPNTGATNESGFSAIGGCYRQIGGAFTALKTSVLFWGVTGTNSPYLSISYNSETSSVGANDNKIQGFSLRLIKD